MPVNRSEGFVSDLCDRSFLVPWAYLNPALSGGRELIDAAVVFGDSIILFSVKEYLPRDSDADVARNRWIRKAIDASLKQLRGARRRLQTTDVLTEPSSERTVDLPPPSRRKVHSVSISLGGLQCGRFGSQQTDDCFVHVLDEAAFIPHFTELNTVSEFLGYLEYREQVQSTSGQIITEENWLGSYLLNRLSGDSFASQPMHGSFDRYLNDPRVVEPRKIDPPSYFWDHTIQYLWSERGRLMAPDTDIGSMPPSAEMMDAILRQLAIHPRAERRHLGSSLLHYFSHATDASARVFRAQSGPGYVVQRLGHDDDMKSAQAELLARCMYAQECLMPDRNVVGIAAGPDFPDLSPDVLVLFCYLEGAVGTEAMRKKVRELAKDLGLFQNLRSYDVKPEKLGLPPKKP